MTIAEIHSFFSQLIAFKFKNPLEYLNYSSFLHMFDICLFQDGLNDIHDLKSSLPSFPVKPLQALKYDFFLALLLCCIFFLENGIILPLMKSLQSGFNQYFLSYYLRDILPPYHHILYTFRTLGKLMGDICCFSAYMDSFKTVKNIEPLLNVFNLGSLTRKICGRFEDFNS